MVIINPGGGVLANGSDGLKILINSDDEYTSAGIVGQDQFFFAGTYQYCCGAGAPMLSIGGTLFGQAGPASGSTNWTSITVDQATGSTTTSLDSPMGTSIGNGTVTVHYTATSEGLSYTMDRAISYTYPNSYVNESYTFSIPNGNTSAVKFYLGGDTAPGSSDQGYGVMLTSPVRSVISLNTSSRIQFGMREVAGSKIFDGATSQSFSVPYGTVQSGGDIGYVVTASNHDAGLMVQWNLGSTPGTFTAALEEFVSYQEVGLSAQFRHTTFDYAVEEPFDFNLTNTLLTNSTGNGFTFTFPNGMAIGTGTQTNTCGGTLTATAATNLVTVSGVNVNATTNCLITIPVAVAAPGNYAVGPTSVSGIAGDIFNRVANSSVSAFSSVTSAPVWVDQALGAMSVGVYFNDGVVASGWPLPTFAVGAGLPAGLTLDAATGAITGVPTTADPYSFTITASSSQGSITADFAGTVLSPPAPPAFSDALLAGFQVGIPYADGVRATGSPAPTYAVTAGILPAGIVLNATTGVVSGTPTTPGAYTFTITAANGVGSPVAQLFSGTTKATSAFTDDVLGGFQVGIPYADGVAATGTPAPTLSVTAGNLPAGITFNAATGAVTGTPTTRGTYTFTITATNGIGAPAAKTFSDVVKDVTIVTDAVLGGFQVGVPYADGVAATGSPAPTFSVTAGSLPAGITLDETTGAVTGTPTTPGPYAFTITAANGVGSAVAQPFSGTTKETSAFTDLELGGFQRGVPYTDSVAATGTPAPTLSVTAGNLPAGISFNAATGAVTGTPTTPGAYTFTITASNGIGAPAAHQFSGTITDVAVFTDDELGGFQVGVPYNDGLIATGPPAPTFTVTSGTLPDGISLDETTGAVTGTPTTPGDYAFTITATNGIGDAAHETFNGTVTATPVFSDETLGDFQVGVSYDDGIAATGTPAPSYAVSSGNLPDGISLDVRTGAITGTPTTAGPHAFTITISNRVGTADRVFAGVVKAAPAIVLDLTLEVGAEVGSADATAYVHGSGLRPGSAYVVEMHSAPVILATGTVDDVGAFAQVVTIPADAAPGSHALTVSGTDTEGRTHTDTAYFSITSAGTIGAISEVAPIPSVSSYLALTPRRLLDTRDNDVRVAAGSVTKLRVAGLNGVPADSTAVELNFTATDSTEAGFITVFSCGSAVPTASNINWTTRETVANRVVASLDDSGDLCLFSSAATHLVVDVNGAYSPTAGTSSLVALAPQRLLDTRGSGIKAVAGSVTELQVTGSNGVPSDATAVVLNVTSTGPDASGFVTVFPCGLPVPTASNVNFVAGQTIANSVTATVGANGNVCLFTDAATHLVVDVNGAYSPTAGTSSLVALAPQRLLDTRGSAIKTVAGSVTELQVTGSNGVPSDATAVVLNVTSTGPEAAGYVTVFPCGLPVPTASNVNFVAGQTIANAVTATVGSNGKVCLFTDATTHLIVDLDGAYAGPSQSG